MLFAANHSHFVVCTLVALIPAPSHPLLWNPPNSTSLHLILLHTLLHTKIVSSVFSESSMCLTFHRSDLENQDALM